MTNEIITLETAKSYASEKNLIAGLERLGLSSFADEGETPCRYIIARTPEGRWTAIFLVTEYFRRNNTGGYAGFASQHGFISI